MNKRISDFGNAHAKPITVLSSDRTPRKFSAIPYEEPVRANNGLIYQSNPKYTRGYGGNNGKLPAGIEPINSLDIFESSKVIGQKRFSFDSQGNIHQFLLDGKTWHWAGSTNDSKSPLYLDNQTKSKLRILFPEHQNNGKLK